MSTSNNNNNNEQSQQGSMTEPEPDPDQYISEEEIQFCNSCVLKDDENCVRVEGQENINDIVNRDFFEELRKSYNPVNETGDELGRLIKMKRLTETYITLINKNVEKTPQIKSVIEQCEHFVLKIKSNIRELCTHIITEDDIEVGERIIHIIYCNRCETMFN
jgi:hypothetical protein